MFLVHHPLTTIASLYIGLVGVVVQMDAGVVLVAFVPVVSAVLAYLLSKRERRAIRKESADAASALEAHQAEISGKVEEVHGLVNGTNTRLETALATANARIDSLEQFIRAAPGVEAAPQPPPIKA